MQCHITCKSSVIQRLSLLHFPPALMRLPKMKNMYGTGIKATLINANMLMPQPTPRLCNSGVMKSGNAAAKTLRKNVFAATADAEKR